MSQPVEARPCGWVLERLEAWIDDELNEAERALVTAHVEGCKSCRREQRVAEEVVAELRALPDFELPEAVAREVARKTRQGGVERFSPYLEGLFRRPLPAVAALAAVVAMIIVVWPWRDGSRPQYSEQEIARASSELRLAFAYVGAITRRAELRVGERVFDHDAAGKAVRSVRRSIQIIGEAGTPAMASSATPQPTAKGS